MNKLTYNLFLIFLSFSSFLFGWFIHSQYKPQEIKKVSLLEKIKKRKTLNVVLLNSPSTYYIDASGEQGFEYDLIKAYAKHLHVDLNVTVAHTIQEAIKLGENPNIDIVSASISKTPLREKKFHFGPSYFEVQEEVICNRDMLNTAKFPKDIEDLKGLKIEVGTDTSYSETIKLLQNEGYDINATYSSHLSTEELLEKVATREIDCTIADSNVYTINLRYYPEIALAFAVSDREQLAWILTDGSDDLEMSMYTWLNSFVQKGSMRELKEHYYSYVIFFDYYNTKMFYRRVKSRLPRYREYFMQASAKYDLPWTLLAAISYQESHWNPNAKSFTGVRGLMMLTKKTAKLLGVKNRINPKESIFGGAKHFNSMTKLVPKEVEGENRLKFALAAYNIGMGHIYDAQLLAKKFGFNPNIWSDLKKVLPLLAQKKYYRTLKYGYARGEEPVNYVEAIYNYKDILSNIEENTDTADE